MGLLVGRRIMNDGDPVDVVKGTASKVVKLQRDRFFRRGWAGRMQVRPSVGLLFAGENGGGRQGLCRVPE